ncbi:hypothetical protein GGI25_006105 [Coemansia spiralis]|uniref:Dienelactone hydrolase domain-containing protein n=2 Tax=Coemansia TaxID=4863 RepID=A0A9W8G3A3_9FUNG|nr:Alpha/Beta hydrolase protein [Coemansia spiralis]KAJ1986023.1 hypothetical protein EDC05_006447 [Coemansia umbellata]KAJ2618633.1 hypothetical protein GGI26_006456 [Coemansia sp. RSA 1358]KAJ2669547.1 hypothetical protein GGI25_006105 [Coemansia spiralis]
MSFIAACCNTPPVQAEYTPIGETHKDGTMEYYVVGDKGAKQGVVFCFDIFGFHPNALQVADVLGRSGFRVIMPDFLEGNPLTKEKMADGQWFAEFKAERAGWAYSRAMFMAAVSVLRAEGVENIGSVGFCWGAKLTVRALAEGGEQGTSGVKSGVLIHPSMMEQSDFEEAAGPVLLLPTKDEADFTEFFEIAKAKPFGEASYQERFEAQIHGFCGARGEFSKPEVASDVNRAMQLTVGFFKKTLA